MLSTSVFLFAVDHGLARVVFEIDSTELLQIRKDLLGSETYLR